MEDNKKDITAPKVYIPKGARINLENKEQISPATEYNKRVRVFDIEAVKKFVKGIYGRK